jgi:hypothetical protein
MRLLNIVFVGCAAIASAAEAPVSCIKNEIAYIDSFAGSWHDQTYQNRPLVKHLPVCSDSKLVRLKDGTDSSKDYLKVNSVMGDPLRFDCAQPHTCDNAIAFTEVNKKLNDKLNGMSPLASLLYSFSHFQEKGTPTISRGPEQNFTDPKLNSIVISAGEPIKASLVFAAAQVGKTYYFDLCLNAEKQDCNESLAKSKPYRFDDPYLPFGKVPPGLHVLYEVQTLPNDTVALRTENRTFILAADPSWTPEDLEFVRTSLALTLLDPDTASHELDGKLVSLGAALALPRH